MKKLYTAYNNDVQKYMTGNDLSSGKKKTIIEHIEKTVTLAGESFERLFPTRTKRKDVMDHIIYLLSGNGICKVSATTLAKKTDCSVRTVNNAVSALKKTSEVLVGGLADGKNKYVFVLKSHKNFKAIMKDVFYIDADLITKQNANHVAEQENSETLETLSVDSEKTVSNINNPFNSINSLKQEKNNYKESIKDSIENELKESQNDVQKEFERINEYYVNEYQEMMYYTIKSSSFHYDLKMNASLIGFRVGSNCDKDMFNMALNAVGKIDRFLKNGGTISDSVQALFSKVYEDNIKTSQKTNTSKSEKFGGHARKIPFYNWLEEDGSKVTLDDKITNLEADEMGLF